MDIQCRHMECRMYGKAVNEINAHMDILLTFPQIWDVFEGEHLLTGQDPELKTYRSRAHLAEMVALLGPPPSRLLARGNMSHKFFSEEGG